VESSTEGKLWRQEELGQLFVDGPCVTSEARGTFRVAHTTMDSNNATQMTDVHFPSSSSLLKGKGKASEREDDTLPWSVRLHTFLLHLGLDGVQGREI
jgi:hypothetical protein